MNPVFKNRPNQPKTLADGSVLWHSRSNAVVGHIVVSCGGALYILLGKRGPKCPDHIGKWTLPCGYLDWDETLWQALLREVWEEAGLDVAGLLETHSLLHGGLQMPWDIMSDPTRDARQNVSHHFGVVLEVGKLPALTTAYCEPGECADVRWVALEDAIRQPLAFGHEKNIQRLIQHFGLCLARDYEKYAPNLLA